MKALFWPTLYKPVEEKQFILFYAWADLQKDIIYLYLTCNCIKKSVILV